MSKHLTYDHMVTVQQDRAKRLGLRLEHYNSGTVRSDTSGWRVFRGTDRVDYFNGKHLAHCRDGREMRTWLDGYECAVDGRVDRELAVQP